MGQMPFDPPNVRGWVGGRAWINSATLAARRQVIAALMQPINEDALNGDEQLELAAAYADGVSNFTLDAAKVAGWAALPAPERAKKLVQRYVPKIAGTDLDRGPAPSPERTPQPTPRPPAPRPALAPLPEPPTPQLC